MRALGGGGSTNVREGSSGEDGQGLRVGTQVTCEAGRGGPKRPRRIGQRSEAKMDRVKANKGMG